MLIEASGNALSGPITEYRSKEVAGGTKVTIELFIPNVTEKKLDSVTQEHLDILIGGRMSKERILNRAIRSGYIPEEELHDDVEG